MQATTATTASSATTRRGGAGAPLGQGRRKIRAAHQELVDTPCRASTLGNGPDDQRLPTLHVAGGEDTWHTRHPVPITPDVPPVGHPHAERLQHPASLRP